MATPLRSVHRKGVGQADSSPIAVLNVIAHKQEPVYQLYIIR